MGTGHLESGRFDLTVSIQHHASATRIDAWKKSFQRASELLFNATDGQHEFGTISVNNDSLGTKDADFRLNRPNGQSQTPGESVKGIGLAGTYGILAGSERFHPLNIVHEFAHYAYGVYDEYEQDDEQPAHCIGGNTSDACIMEARAQEGDRLDDNGNLVVHGRITEFCAATNHDHAQPTQQQTIKMQSCWETMEAACLGLVAPQGTPTGAPPPGAGDITWTLLQPVQRFVLVVDRSLLAGTGGASRVLTAVKVGAAWWTDAALIGDSLGVVSFGRTARTAVGLTTISQDRDRTAIHTAIAGLRSRAGTSLRSGLQAGLATVRAAGPRSANQALILVTDGLQDDGENAADVIPDLVRSGVRVYVVGVGPTVNAPLLHRIATGTGGAFHRVDPTLSVDHQALRLRAVLQQLAQTTHDNVEVVAARPGRVQPQEPVVHHVVIEPKSIRATFGVSWIGPVNALRLTVVAPDETVIAHDAVPTGVREITASRPDAAFQVDRPLAGVWRIEIHHALGGDPVDHHLFVTSEHHHVNGLLHARPRLHRQGTVVPLFLQVHHDLPVTGLAVRGVVRLPGGGAVMLRLSDDGDPSVGDRKRDDGVYSALFTDTQSPGTYTVEVEVNSDGRFARYPERGRPAELDESLDQEPVPAFQRRLETTFVVEARREPT